LREKLGTRVASEVQWAYDQQEHMVVLITLKSCTQTLNNISEKEFECLGNGLGTFFLAFGNTSLGKVVLHSFVC
jgi:hypothetical protein